jgi:simple sugar transport system permease protein
MTPMPRGAFPDPAVRAAAWTIALSAALAIFCAFVLALGKDPLAVVTATVRGAFGTPLGLSRTVGRAIPLLLLSAGLIPAFRARFWNIGLNGSMLMGATAATGIALYLPLGSAAATSLAMVAGAIGAGAVWALVPGVLRLRFGTPEIIVSLLMNYVAQRIVDYLVFSAWKNPAGRGFPGTATFDQSLWLARWDATKTTLPTWLPLPDGVGPPLQAWLRAWGNSNIHTGLAIALLAVAGIAVLMNRSTWGLRIDVAGQGSRAARYLGISTGKVLLLVSVLGGGLAGIAGWSEVAGLNHRLEAGIGQELGYTAILVVALGALRPGLTAIAAFLVAGLLVGGSALQISFGLPSALAGVLLWAILYGVINGQNLAERWAGTPRRGGGGPSSPTPDPPPAYIPLSASASAGGLAYADNDGRKLSHAVPPTPATTREGGPT